MAIFNSYVSLPEGIWELYGSLAFTVRSVSVGGVPRVTLARLSSQLGTFPEHWQMMGRDKHPKTVKIMDLLQEMTIISPMKIHHFGNLETICFT